MPIFDLETSNWISCKTKPFIKTEGGEQLYPCNRKCHSLAVIGNDCYMCGGTNGKVVCSDVWHINLEELKWTRLVEFIPYPVYFHGASISLNAKLTIFGGVETITGDFRNNKLTSVWFKIPSLKNICLSAVSYYVKNGTLNAGAIKTTGFSEALEIIETIVEK